MKRGLTVRQYRMQLTTYLSIAGFLALVFFLGAPAVELSEADSGKAFITERE